MFQVGKLTRHHSKLPSGRHAWESTLPLLLNQMLSRIRSIIRLCLLSASRCACYFP